MKHGTLCTAFAALVGFAIASPVQAESFTYHGQLQDGGQAANGRYDLQLTLYSAQTGGAVLAGPITLHDVSVKDGNFLTNVDFGPLAPLTQQAWAQISVKSGGGDFVKLDNRSPVAPQGNACPGSWTLDGNAGNPSGSYLGTADNNAVVVKANDTIAGLFYPDGNVGLAFPYGPGAGVLYSTAIGERAGTKFSGSIVTGGFSDATFDNTIRDTATNQVIFVAQHGVGINTAKAPNGEPLRDELTIAPSGGLPGANADLSLITPSAGYGGFNINVAPTGYLNINGLYNESGTLAYDSCSRSLTSTAQPRRTGASMDRPRRIPSPWEPPRATATAPT